MIKTKPYTPRPHDVDELIRMYRVLLVRTRDAQ